ncbi:MAG: isoprenylcysteine carboxylmethyltransferase family protein [Chloroflexota bacterium]
MKQLGMHHAGFASPSPMELRAQPIHIGQALTRVAWQFPTIVGAAVLGLVAWVRTSVAFGGLAQVTPGELESVALTRLVLSGVNHAFTATFMFVVAAMLIIRRPSRASANSWLADAVAMAGSLIVLVLAFAPGRELSIEWLVVSDVLLVLGMGITVAGVTSLGRCFGIMPRARGLVRSGLYRFVRHPIYLGEFIAFAGLLIAVFSPFTLAVYAVFVGLQIARTYWEEAALSSVFPEYREYRLGTRRVIPWIY